MVWTEGNHPMFYNKENNDDMLNQNYCQKKVNEVLSLYNWN